MGYDRVTNINIIDGLFYYSYTYRIKDSNLYFSPNRIHNDKIEWNLNKLNCYEFLNILIKDFCLYKNEKF